MTRDSSKLLIEESPLQVLPSLACLLGGAEPAIVLQQVHYWVGVIKKTKQKANFRDGHWWVHNTYAEWRETFPWIPERTLRRIMANLEGRGSKDDKLPRLLISEQRSGSDRRKWYRIDYEALNDFLAASEASDGEVEQPPAESPTPAPEAAEDEPEKSSDEAPSPSTGQSGPLRGDDAQPAKMAASRSTGQSGRLEEANLDASSMPSEVLNQTTPSVGSPNDDPVATPVDDRGGGGRANARGRRNPKTTTQAPSAQGLADRVREALRRRGHGIEEVSALEPLIAEAEHELELQDPERITDRVRWCLGYVDKRAGARLAAAEREARAARRRRDPRWSWLYEAADLVEADEVYDAEEILRRNGFEDDQLMLIIDLRWDADRVIAQLGLDPEAAAGEPGRGASP